MKQEKLQQIREIFNLANKDYATSEQLMKGFKAVVDYVNQVKDVLASKMAKNKAETDSEIRDVVNSMSKIEKELKAMIDKKFSTSDMQKMMKACMDEIENVKEMIPELSEIPDMSVYDRKLAGMDARISKIPEVMSSSEVNDLVLTLKRSFEDELIQIRKEVSKSQYSKVAGMRKVPILKKYNLTSMCDGNTKSFILPVDTTDVLGVFGTQFPIQFDPASDWTFSGRTLTLGSSVSAPQSGQTLWVLIEVLFY